MKNTNTNKIKPQQFKDVSRYTRWINRMDEMDQDLSPVKRKTKWLLFLGSLFLFFVLSFILFPAGKFNHNKLSNPGFSAEQAPHHRSAVSPLEWPTDSFENLLKSQIHENVPEKE